MSTRLKPAGWKWKLSAAWKAFTFMEKYLKSFAFEVSRWYLHFEAVIGVDPSDNFFESKKKRSIE